MPEFSGYYPWRNTMKATSFLFLSLSILVSSCVTEHTVVRRHEDQPRPRCNTFIPPEVDGFRTLCYYRPNWREKTDLICHIYGPPHAPKENLGRGVCGDWVYVNFCDKGYTGFIRPGELCYGHWFKMQK